jgi:hypothetical protein
MNNYDWLDKYIEQEQREIMERVCDPFNPEELCEIISEDEETND